MDDAIAVYRAASEANDLDRLLPVLARLRMTDAMAFDLAPDGRIRRIRPHLRTLLGTMLFAALLGPKVGVHPGVVLRPLRG